MGFKCLHYQVTEGDGFVVLTIVNKLSTDFSVGVRTQDGTALNGEDYVGVEEVVEFKGQEKEKNVKVEIIDDDQWEPD